MAKDKPLGNVKFGIDLGGFDETLNTLDKVNKAFKVSESNLKTVVSTFDKAGASIDDLAKKQDALSDVTELQSKRVDILSKRREEYIKTYGEESDQVANVTKQINQATTKYNGYAKQLNETKQSYILASSGVDDYTKALKDNEKALAEEVKAFKESGDKAGELEARQKGLTKQASLTEKAIEAQKTAIAKLADEFGESSTEVKKAETYLESLQRTSSNTGTRLKGVESALSELSNEAKDTVKTVDKVGDTIEDAGDKGSSAEGGFNAAASALGGLVGGLAASISTKALDLVTESLAQVKEGFDSVREAQTKLSSQTFFGEGEVKQLTQYANDLVKVNVFETIDEATEALTETYSALGARVQDPLQLTDITRRASILSKTFDTDVNEVIRGASGLATSFGISIQEAFDYLGYGAKNGLNYSNELFDNVAEYAPQFAQNEYSAAEFFETLTLGLDGGAYNLDKVNDLVKEFGVRVADGTIEGAIENIGGDFADLFYQFKRGEIDQRTLLRGFAQGIDKVKDSTKQATLVSELFGSVGEDNGVKVITTLGEVGEAYDDVAGITNMIGDDLASTTPLELLRDRISGVIGEIGIWASTLDSTNILDGINYFFEITLYEWKDNVVQLAQGFIDFGNDVRDKLKEIDPSLETFNGVLSNFGGIVETVVNVALYSLNKSFQTLGEFFTDTVVPTILPLLSEWSDRLGRITEYFGGTTEATDKFKKAIDLLWKLAKARLEVMFKLFTTVFRGISTLIEIVAAGIAGTWNTFTALLEGNWRKALNSIRQTLDRVFNAIWISIKDTWVGRLISAIGNFTSGAAKKITQWTTDVSRDVTNFLNKLVNWFKQLPDRIASAFKNGGNTIKNAFKSVFNGVLSAIGKPVNAIIGGANFVLTKLGADALPKWEVPQYANGTDGHPGGPMMVNDGRGAEMVIAPNGKAFIPQGRNVVMSAPAGTHVLTAEETAMVTGAKRPKYRYANGTGLLDGVKETIGNISSTLKNTVGDVFEYATNPGKLVEKVFSSIGALDGLTKFPLQVGSAILKKATSAMIDKVKGLFDAGGNLDLSTGNLGVYKYLADVAKQVMAKYSGFVATSGYRPGDPHDHGKRNAIDIALPGVVNGSPKYEQAGNYAFEKFPSKVGYVIANDRVKDRSGKSGTGIHDNWVKWNAGGHMDHVHISGVKDPESQKGSGENFTGNVGSYANIATQALRLTGQYNSANLKALLNQMRTESNGNPKAINNWDINAKNGTPSKGLMQVIDPTFKAYALPGYNSNIYDPLSNILASIRYTLARYGSLTAGWRGVGYENGGLITRQHLAMVGEKNRPEMVIPLHSSKRSRAMELLAQAQERLGVTNQATLVSTGGSDADLMTQLIQQQSQTNALLQALLEKDSNVYIDKNKLVGQVAPSIDKYNSNKTRMSNRLAGNF